MTINEKRRGIQDDVIDAFEENDFNGFGLVPTGTGKAWILIQILNRVKPKSCWYLCDSTRNRDFTFKNELIKWGGEKWIDKIEFMCYQTAYKLKNFNVDLLLADEADFGLSPQYRNAFLKNKFKHKILVSGTLGPDKYAFLNELNIPIVYSIGINEVEEQGVLNKANYFLVNYMLSAEENRKYLSFNRRFVALIHASRNKKELEMLQIMRKHFMSNLKSSVNACRKLMKHLYEDEDNKILIFCGLSDQADAVCKYRYHSKVDDEDFKKFDRGDLRVLSVVAKADRGLNINGVNVIIFEAPTRSSTKFFQRTGRGRRLSVNKELNVYFLIPYYKDRYGHIKPTIVLDWVYKSATKIENFKPRNYKLND